MHTDPHILDLGFDVCACDCSHCFDDTSCRCADCWCEGKGDHL